MSEPTQANAPAETTPSAAATAPATVTPPSVNVVEYADPENKDTRQFGYEWMYGPVSYKPERTIGSKVQLGTTPYLRVTDTVKFEAYLPGVIAASLDGTSIKVRCQGVTRPMISKNRKVSADDMKRAILNSLRGVRAPRTATVIERVVTQKVYLANDDTEFATALEAKQWNMALKAEEEKVTE